MFVGEGADRIIALIREAMDEFPVENDMDNDIRLDNYVVQQQLSKAIGHVALAKTGNLPTVDSRIGKISNDEIREGCFWLDHALDQLVDAGCPALVTQELEMALVHVSMASDLLQAGLDGKPLPDRTATDRELAAAKKRMTAKKKADSKQERPTQGQLF
jgi:hypothetical protein